MRVGLGTARRALGRGRRAVAAAPRTPLVPPSFPLPRVARGAGYTSSHPPIPFGAGTRRRAGYTSSYPKIPSKGARRRMTEVARFKDKKAVSHVLSHKAGYAAGAVGLVGVNAALSSTGRGTNKSMGRPTGNTLY